MGDEAYLIGEELEEAERAQRHEVAAGRVAVKQLEDRGEHQAEVELVPPDAQVGGWGPPQAIGERIGRDLGR